MESRLQSNEVRIPKTSGSAPVSSAAAAVVSSSAFMRSRSENGAAPQYHHHHQQQHQTHHNPPDFDLNAPCQYFKSSFARSLSLNSSNQTKSLDFGINFGLSRSSPIREEPQTPVAFGQDKCAAAYLVEMPPPPLPLTQPPTMSTGSGHSAAAPGPSNGSSSRNVWSTSPKQSFNRRSLDSSEIEVLRLRKECQNLVEENRRLMGLASGVVGGNLVVPGNSSNIEAVILQTQVDTLQWQLKQVEASRQMYRAVMEEVVRFLERCHRNLDSMQNEQISRSKSIHHVYRNDSTNSTSNNNNNNNSNNNDGSNPASPRARSSTNLMDVQKSCQSKSNEEPSTTTSPVASYNNFRDFTWRRSPKRAASQLATTECDPEKLSQDAFRLLRTAQNLLNTQEPDLTQPKHTIELQYSTNYINPTVPVQSKSNAPSTSSKPKSCQLDCESFCLTFSRKMNMRESRLSLRSSTDSSVHSTSSSKNETDEENHSPPITKETTACSTTEDESGFSSISSFQEIGLPLHSTMISPIPTNNSSISDDSGESNTDICLDSRNSTLKASQTSMGSNVGLPLPPNHRRWDSAPAVPPRTNLHRFSTLPPDDSPTVLWV